MLGEYNDLNHETDKYHDHLHAYPSNGPAPTYSLELFDNRALADSIHHHHYEGTGAQHSGFIVHTHPIGHSTHEHVIPNPSYPDLVYGYSVHSH